MIDTMHKLENSGIIEDVRLTYPENSVAQTKGTLSTYNVTIRSIRETQPQRKTVTDSVWGMDGEYDFSTPETYTRRSFSIVFNIYEECGDRFEQRNSLVKWLKGADCRGKTTAFKNAVKMEFSTRKNTYYTDLWIDIGEFKRDSGGKGRYQSTLAVTISTAPRFYKDGELII